MDFKLEELIDVSLFQNLQEKLNLVYSFPSAIIDNDGKVLTAVAWQDICTKFHRTNPQCEKECIKSDQYIIEHLHEANPAVSYQCPHGLVDNATPIIIDGKHLGNFFTGQFFLEKPDIAFFRKQAKKYGFDEKTYLEAVEKVPIWTKEKLNLYLDFIKGFIEIIASIGLNHLKEIESNKLIRANEERNKAIIQSTSDWIWEIDLEGKYCYCSEKVENVLGYKPDEIIGKTPFDLMPPDERKRMKDRFSEILKEKASIVDLENWNLHKDGHKVCLLTNGFPIFDESGEIIGYRGADKDITERKISEQRIIESEEKFRLLYTSMEQGMALHEVITDDKGKVIDYVFLDINDSYTKLLGLTREMSIGKRIREVMPKVEQYWIDIFGKVALTGEPSYYENFLETTGRYYATYSYCPKKFQFAVLITDITERKEAEKKLQESELKYRSLIESSSDAIFCVDEKGEYQFTNHLFASTFGKTPEYFIGKTFWDVYDKEHADQRYEATKRLFKSGESESIEVEVPLPDKTLYFLATTNPIKDEKGKVILNLTHAANITELKSSQKALAELNQFNQQIINSVQEGIIVYDKNLCYKVWNPFMEKISGLSASEVLGKHPSELFPFLDESGVIKSLQKTLNGELAKAIDFPFILPGIGKSGWTTDKDVPFRDVNGEIIGVIGTVHDITERKNAEDALRESEEKYRKLVELSPDAVLIHIDGIIQFANKASVELFEAINADEIIGISVLDLVHPDYRSLVKQRVGKIINEEVKAPEIEEKLITLKGNSFFAEVSALPIMINGKNGVQVVARDITERKLAEEKIREKDIEFRKLSANVPDLIYQFTRRTDGSYCVPIASEGIRNIFGCSPEDVIDDFTPISNVIYPEDAERVINDIENSAKNLSFFTCEFRVQIPGKPIQWIFSRSNPEKLPDGSITWYGFNVNITLQKQIEEDLEKAKIKAEESEEIFRKLFEDSSDPILLIDEKGVFVECNQAALDLLKMTRKQFLLLQPVDISPYHQPNGRKSEEAAIDMMEFAYKNGIHRFDWTCIDSEGKEFIVEVSLMPISLKGQILLHTTWRDITKRKYDEFELIKAKEKAEENELQLNAIIENSPTGFAINKISNGEVTYVNKSFANAYHIPVELCSKVSTFFEYVYGDQMDLGNKILDDVRTEDPERMKWTLVPVTDKKTKKTHYVNASNIILKELDLMISTVTDITSQVENENELNLAKEKAEESDRLKSAFLANMSHEIRTPMNGILGFASLLKEPDLSGAEKQRYIGVIEKSGERMLNLINDIISISKIESGLTDLSISEMNINEHIGEIHTFFQPEATKKGIEFYFKKGLTDQDAILKTDRDKFYAILTNLVKNAIKYTHKGSIELGYNMVKGIKNYGTLEFYVKDTGLGIAQNRQKAIFERFIQADIEDKMARQGAGLGLSIAKAYVEMLGGKIWVESEPGAGSVFYFTIPCNVETKEKIKIHTHALSANEEKKIDPKSTGLKILIVEDDENSCAYLKVITKQIGKETLLAKSGIEAVKACRKNPDIDLVLMDIKMSEMDGYQATRQIRQFNKDVIIIAQTAYALAGDKDKALEAGCNDYISKPVKKGVLLELIGKYF